MRTLLIHTHNGLGDLIICNGMVRHLYKKMKNNFDEIYLLVEKNYEVSINFLYKDLLKEKLKILFFNCGPKNESLTAMKSTYQNYTHILRIGFEYFIDIMKRNNWNFSIINWDECFYKQLNLNFDMSYEDFYFPELPPKINFNLLGLKENEKFNLIHEDISRNFIINKELIKNNYKNIFIDNKITPNVFSNIYLAEKAEEIHLIPSSILCYFDRMLQLKEKNKYIHQYLRNTALPTLRNNWRILYEL